MSVYQIHGFQPDDTPHWETALIEAEDPERAKAILYSVLTEADGSARPETVRGWDDDLSDGAYRDPETWRVDAWTTPVRFVLGGGCR